MNAVRSDIIAVANDLMFASRIRGAAQQAGAEVKFVRSASDLAQAAGTARLVLLDLETRWLDAPHAIAELKRGAGEGPVVVAFASHVLGDVLTAAREAGADRVLARSAFLKVLPELLQ